AATCFTPADASSARRTTRTGKSWPTGSTGRSRNEGPRPRSGWSCRAVVGAKDDAASAAQVCVRCNDWGRLWASQQCLMRLPFARGVERLKKLHLPGGEQRNGQAVAVKQAVTR